MWGTSLLVKQSLSQRVPPSRFHGNFNFGERGRQGIILLGKLGTIDNLAYVQSALVRHDRGPRLADDVATIEEGSGLTLAQLFNVFLSRTSVISKSTGKYILVMDSQDRPP
jgi:hypothetical protein